jgi:hypothetical protein
MSTTTLEREEVEAIAEPEFRIDSDERAEWLLRKLANIEAEKARVQAQAAAMLRALESDAERLHFLFGGQLQDYVRLKIAQAGGRRKSVLFFNATAGFRTVPPGLRLADPGAAFHYAQETGVALKSTVSLDTTAYRDAAAAHFRDTGGFLPGIEAYEGREAFAIKFSEGK